MGEEQVQPDCFFRLAAAGKAFNVAFEIDNSTESLDSNAAISVRKKLTTYHGYQEQVLSQWLAAGKKWERPRFRVVFLTQSIERAHHILSLAAETTRNKSRRLVYAATLESYITADDPLHTPLLLDHRGEWQSIVELHPTASYRKTPVRLARPLPSPLGVC